MKHNLKYENLANYGDILAIPFFALLTLYFYMIEHKSIVETVLFYFSIAGLVMDIIYSYIFFR